MNFTQFLKENIAIEGSNIVINNVDEAMNILQLINSSDSLDEKKHKYANFLLGKFFVKNFSFFSNEQIEEIFKHKNLLKFINALNVSAIFNECVNRDYVLPSHNDIWFKVPPASSIGSFYDYISLLDRKNQQSTLQHIYLLNEKSVSDYISSTRGTIGKTLKKILIQNNFGNLSFIKNYTEEEFIDYLKNGLVNKHEVVKLKRLIPAKKTDSLNHYISEQWLNEILRDKEEILQLITQNNTTLKETPKKLVQLSHYIVQLSPCFVDMLMEKEPHFGKQLLSTCIKKNTYGKKDYLNADANILQNMATFFFSENIEPTFAEKLYINYSDIFLEPIKEYIGITPINNDYLVFQAKRNNMSLFNNIVPNFDLLSSYHQNLCVSYYFTKLDTSDNLGNLSQYFQYFSLAILKEHLAHYQTKLSETTVEDLSKIVLNKELHLHLNSNGIHSAKHKL